MPDANKKIKGCGFHHVSIKASDLKKSIKFYTEALGFVEKVSWGEAPKRTVLLDTGDGNYFEISQADPDVVNQEGVFRHLALRLSGLMIARLLSKRRGQQEHR